MRMRSLWVVPASAVLAAVAASGAGSMSPSQLDATRLVLRRGMAQPV